MTAISAITPHHNQVAYFQGTETDLTLALHDGREGPVVLQTGLRCPAAYQRIVWGPRGQTLYYAAADSHWYYNIWQVELPTGNATQLTDYYRVNTFPLQLHPSEMALLTLSNLRGEMNVRLYTFFDRGHRKITDYASPVRAAVYDPEGLRIAYSANATYNPHNLDIYLMDADGFDKRRLLGTLAGAADVVCDWSADGRYLAVESNFDGGIQIGVFDLYYGSPEWYSAPDDGARVVGFSPDSAHLLARGPGRYLVYNLATRSAAVLEGYTAAAWHDGARLLLGTATGALLHYHLADGKVIPFA